MHKRSVFSGFTSANQIITVDTKGNFIALGNACVAEPKMKKEDHFQIFIDPQK